MRTLKLRLPFLVVVLCGPRNFTRNEGSEVKNLTCHAPRSELVFEQLLVCRTRHDRDPEGNVNARICVKIRNRDLESGLKYLNPTLGCKDIKCMEYSLSPVLRPTLLNCLYADVHLNRQ